MRLQKSSIMVVLLEDCSRRSSVLPGRSALVLAAVISTLGGLVFGYELGIISGALPQLRLRFHLSCVEQEAVVSSLLVGAVLASAIGGWLIDRQGRRASILLSNLLVVGGSLILGVGTWFTTLISGRVVVGFAMSVSSMSCCIFVSEMVSPKRRGLMVTLYEVGVTNGILLAYAVNYALSGVRDGWRYMFGLVIVPSLAQLVSIYAFPSRLASLSQSGDGGTANGDLTRTSEYMIKELFSSKNNMRTRTLIGLGLVIFQQFTGQPNVLFYASTIFQSVGFQNEASAVLASLGLGIVKVAATLAAMFCADKVGRRPLLIGGCSVMAVGLMLIGFLSKSLELDADERCDCHLNSTALPKKLTDDRNNSADFGLPRDVGTLNWLILFSMMSVVAAFSMSFGPMTWVVLSEIFPAEVRGRSFAFSSCFNWVANLIVTFSFLNVVDAMGLSGTFSAYGLMSGAAAIFIYKLLPETKGKSLQEIDHELCQRRVSQRAELCRIFGNRRFSPGYQRLSWTNSAL